MATQILTPNIPSHTYSSLYLKHEVHFANPGISYGCNELKPRRAEEKAAPQPGCLGDFSRRSIRLRDDLQKAMPCGTCLAGVLCSGIATAVVDARGSRGQRRGTLAQASLTIAAESKNHIQPFWVWGKKGQRRGEERETKKERGLHAAPLPSDTLIHAGGWVCDLA